MNSSRSIVLWVIVVLTALYSCKKESNGESGTEPIPDPSKKNVTFKISNFSQEVSQYSQLRSVAATQEDGLYINTLEYLLFNSDGKLVSRILSDDKGGGFGSITDQIAPGSYNVVFFGARSLGVPVPFGSIGQDSSKNSAYFNLGFYYKSKTDGTKDDWYAKEGFAYKGSLDVEDDDNLEVDISLKRISAILDVHLLDAQIPENVAIFKISYDSTYTAYKPYPSDSLVWAKEAGQEVGTSTYEIADRTRKSFLGYPSPVNDNEMECKVYLQAFDRNKKLLFERTIRNVKFKKNMKTILTGYAFDANSKEGYTIGIDPEWKGVQQELEF